MKAPVCRVCNVEHWPREPHQFKGEAAPSRSVTKERDAEPVPSREPVTVRDAKACTVTAVTKLRDAPDPDVPRAPCSDCAALAVRVAAVERQLSELLAGLPSAQVQASAIERTAPKSDAERARAYRQRKATTPSEPAE